MTDQTETAQSTPVMSIEELQARIAELEGSLEGTNLLLTTANTEVERLRGVEVLLAGKTTRLDELTTINHDLRGRVDQLVAQEKDLIEQIRTERRLNAELNRRVDYYVGQYTDTSSQSHSRLVAGNNIAAYLFGGKNPPPFAEVLSKLVENSVEIGDPMQKQVVLEIADMAKSGQTMSIDFVTRRAIKELEQYKEEDRFTTDLATAIDSGDPIGTADIIFSKIGLGGLMQAVRQFANNRAPKK